MTRENDEGERIARALMLAVLGVNPANIEEHTHEDLVEAVMWAFEEIGSADDQEALEDTAEARLDGDMPALVIVT